MSELDDLESYAAPEIRVKSATDQLRQAACRNPDRNARERAAMRRRNRAMVSDKEADLIYARVLAEIRGKP
jgi:exoribonuclease II